jgi:SAM-dependent methyltransferase
METTAPLSKQTGDVLRWPLPSELVSSPPVAYRNAFAKALAQESAPEIVKSYVLLSLEQMEWLYAFACRHLLPSGLCGRGIELGAGCGLLSSVVARDPKVEVVYAVEVCDVMATLVIPKVAAYVLGERGRKVVPVVGSFDDLRFSAGSIDFAVEISSLHHSDDLAKTLAECARVLKRGGILLCFDRCQPNRITDAEVNAMLSKVYPREFLVANHYPPDIRLTRRENGEHEYRLFEWQTAFR